MGDRILFTRNDGTLGVRNGMLGTILAVGDNKLTVHLDPDGNDNRRRLTFKPQEFSSIDHGFAVSNALGHFVKSRFDGRSCFIA